MPKRGAVPTLHLTQQWSRRATAFAPASLRLLARLTAGVRRGNPPRDAIQRALMSRRNSPARQRKSQPCLRRRQLAAARPLAAARRHDLAPRRAMSATHPEIVAGRGDGGTRAARPAARRGRAERSRQRASPMPAWPLNDHARRVGFFGENAKFWAVAVAARTNWTLGSQ
jgi:hypothetical protein